MGASDGRVISTTKVINHKADNTGWNLVILGDGFQESEMSAYETAVQAFINVFQSTAPFDEVWSEINVFRVNVSSTDSGADDPASCTNGTGATARTFFDASFCNNSIRRLLLVDAGLALRIANEQVSAVHMVLVVVNSTIYGGSGGSVAVYSLASGALEIALHEMGHTAFGLADEYEYYAGCGTDTDRDHHSIFEPSEPNVTVESDRTRLKWRQLVDAATPVPTTENADCTMCDPQGNPVSANTVGLFEGAHYTHCDAYRPQFDCRMRNLGQPFCGVCQQAIRENFQCWLGQFECIQTRDDGYTRCTAERDQGYSRCDQTRDDGYNQCCTWWPCSWLCSAWVWVSHIVCTVWTWVSNIVCVAWEWVSSVVCVVWRKLQC